MAKQQAVTQVNLYVASLNSFEDADPVDIRGRPMSQALIIDKTTVTTVVKDLHERFNLARVVFVGDRGMLSDANLEMILGAEAGFIVELKNRISHRGKALAELKRYLEELVGKPLQ